MSDYTPTTQEVRTSYGAAVTFPTMSLPERRRAFDRWLGQVRAEAWDEGHDAGQHNEHEYRPGRAMTNPYRQETDA